MLQSARQLPVVSWLVAFVRGRDTLPELSKSWMFMAAFTGVMLLSMGNRLLLNGDLELPLGNRALLHFSDLSLLPALAVASGALAVVAVYVAAAWPLFRLCNSLAKTPRFTRQSVRFVKIAGLLLMTASIVHSLALIATGPVLALLGAVDAYWQVQMPYAFGADVAFLCGLFLRVMAGLLRKGVEMDTELSGLV